ncbi:MAG: IS4 family transposase [Hyphomonadaceae bacterium]|jgi:IS4 transposase|nr:IS4 family transposase [Hyphomonadaceae bacterium]
MQFRATVFSSLLKAIDRSRFAASVARNKGDRYAKSLSSWEHLLALVYGQLSGADSLRAIETGFNAQGHQHYHLNARPIARSTLADANKRRAPQIFLDVLDQLIAQLGRKARKEATSVMRMIDSTPIPLADSFACGSFNGRIKGLKLHVVLDPATPYPLHTDITEANINDVAFRDQVALEAGITYVFDKGYCHYGWWNQIHAAGAFFVTRPKQNTSWTVLATRPVEPSAPPDDDGFTIVGDQEVTLTSKGGKARTLKPPLRLVTLKRANGTMLTLITNDPSRSAHEIASAYKARWKIELFFKWIKQNLNLSRFMGRNENATKLQIIAAMIAFALIALARHTSRTKLSAQRFRQLLQTLLPSRRCLANLEKPPPINPSKPQPQNPNQLTFQWKHP